MAPRIDPISPLPLNSNSPSSKRLARKPPRKDPAIPKATVAKNPIGSGPGTSNRARKPATAPDKTKTNKNRSNSMLSLSLLCAVPLVCCHLA